MLYFSFNSLLYIFLSVFKVNYISRFFRFSLINPISITWITILPVELAITFIGPLFMVDEGWSNKYYNFSLFVANLVSFIDLILLVFAFRFFKSHPKFIKRVENIIQPLNREIIPRRMFFLACFYLILFIVTFVILASHSIGVAAWVLDPRTGYQLHRDGVGPLYASALLFLSLSFVLFTLYSKNTFKITLILFAYLPLVYLLGSKGFIIQFVIYYCILLWFRDFSHLKSVGSATIFVGFFLVLINYGGNNFIDIVSYFDHYINSTMYYESYFKGEIKLFYGEIWLTDFYKYMPRALFSDKPYVYGFLNVNEHFFPGAAEATNTPAFGGHVQYFADFGIIGVALFSIFNLFSIINYLLIYILYKDYNLSKIKKYSNKLYLFIWLLAPAFMSLFPSFLALILFFFIAKSISFTNRLKVF